MQLFLDTTDVIEGVGPSRIPPSSDGYASVADTTNTLTPKNPKAKFMETPAAASASPQTTIRQRIPLK